MAKFAEEFKEYCTIYGVPEHIEILLMDINGIFRGKWIQGNISSKFDAEDVKLPVSTYVLDMNGEEIAATGLGIVVGDPDGAVKAIPGTLLPIPWKKNKCAQVQVFLEQDDQLLNFDCRNILARVQDSLRSKGYFPVVATELEFYLHKKRNGVSRAPTPPDFCEGAQAYDLSACDRHHKLLKDIVISCEKQEIPTSGIIAEYGPGQYEINFKHVNDALKAADYAARFRRLVKNTALNHSLAATFMARPYFDYPGNSMHVHVSVLDSKGNNIMSDNQDIIDNAIAGSLSVIEGMQAVFAPNINSYRRFQLADFSPAKINWGINNRTKAIRVPTSSGKSARIEHRICGADVNPYLAVAGILYGIELGLENKLKPTDYQANKKLAITLEAAVEAFEKSEHIKKCYGEDFRRIYLALKHNEIARIAFQVSDIEYKTYLEKI